MKDSIISIVGGFGGSLVKVECHSSNNLPTISIIGFATKIVDEAKDRLRAAFTNSNLVLPKKHLTINLSPADLQKDSSLLDLAMAMAILSSSQQIKTTAVEGYIFLGELSLSGEALPVRGIIGLLAAAKHFGYHKFCIPHGNLAQAQLIPDVEIIAIKSLREAYLHFTGTQPTAVNYGSPKELNSQEELLRPSMPDFADIVGQKLAKRGMEIAAAGRHHILISGAPGVGKSMLAKALPGILPPLNHQEVLETTQIHSLNATHFDKIIFYPPLRSPHHSASATSIIGGGSKPLPGEISLAHNGVLFMDELPEFNRMVLESLRQPLEDKSITVARSKETATYPADFILVATQNPCPCGYFGIQNGTKTCDCSAATIAKYQKRISGPIMDRIDLFLVAEIVPNHLLLAANKQSEDSQSIRARVRSAQQLQWLRFGAKRYNSNMSNSEVKELARLSEPARELLNTATDKMALSARAYMRTIKIGRTIADLAKSANIEPQHIAEALQYRASTKLLLTSVG